MQYRIWPDTQRVGALFIAVFLSCCTQHMENQPSYAPYEESAFFPDALSARPLPEGVVPVSAEAVESPPVTLALVQRGRIAFDIYCAPCHGFTGEGDGIIAIRGLRTRPPTFHSDRLREVDSRYLVDVIRDGIGTMPPYGFQVREQDRWAVAAYLRALQLSQWAAAGDLPAEERALIEGKKP